MTAFTLSQFGQHLIGHIHIIAIPSAIGDAKGVHVRVFAKIFQLLLLVVGVDGHQYGTDFCRGIQECEPVGHIGGPDTHVATFLHTNGK